MQRHAARRAERAAPPTDGAVADAFATHGRADVAGLVVRGANVVENGADLSASRVQGGSAHSWSGLQGGRAKGTDGTGGRATEGGRAQRRWDGGKGAGRRGGACGQGVAAGRGCDKGQDVARTRTWSLPSVVSAIRSARTLVRSAAAARLRTQALHRCDVSGEDGCVRYNPPASPLQPTRGCPRCIFPLHRPRISHAL